LTKGHAGCVVGNGDVGQHGVARGIDQLAGVVDFEVAVTGIRRGAIGHLHLKETRAHDGQVQRRLGVDQVALQMQLFSGIDLHTGTEHQAGGCEGVVGGLTARLFDVLIEQVFKDGAVALEARGVHVGQVVGDDVHARLLRVKTCLSYPQ